jgi:hypothetical protein
VISRLFISLCLVGLAWANDTEIGVMSGQTRPMKSSSLRLLREDLRLTVGPQRVVVEVDFHLRNEGPTQRVNLGFPYISKADTLYEDQYVGELEQFVTRVDGQQAQVVQAKGPNILPQRYKSSTWKVWELTFNAVRPGWSATATRAR